MGLNRGTYSVPNLPVVYILGEPNSDDYSSNRALLLDIHVVSGDLSNPDPDDTRAMATMAKKSVEDLTEVTIIARLCTYTTF
jgi:hypothetical protein